MFQYTWTSIELPKNYFANLSQILPSWTNNSKFVVIWEFVGELIYSIFL